MAPLCSVGHLPQLRVVVLVFFPSLLCVIRSVSTLEVYDRLTLNIRDSLGTANLRLRRTFKDSSAFPDVHTATSRASFLLATSQSSCRRRRKQGGVSIKLKSYLLLQVMIPIVY